MTSGQSKTEITHWDLLPSYLQQLRDLGYGAQAEQVVDALAWQSEMAERDERECDGE